MTPWVQGLGIPLDLAYSSVCQPGALSLRVASTSIKLLPGHLSCFPRRLFSSLGAKNHLKIELLPTLGQPHYYRKKKNWKIEESIKQSPQSAPAGACVGPPSLSPLCTILVGLDFCLGVIMLNTQFSCFPFFHSAFENKHFPVLLQTLGKHHFNSCTIFYPARYHGLFNFLPPVGHVDFFFFLLVSFSVINIKRPLFSCSSLSGASINIYERRPA